MTKYLVYILIFKGRVFTDLPFDEESWGLFLKVTLARFTFQKRIFCILSWQLQTFLFRLLNWNIVNRLFRYDLKAMILKAVVGCCLTWSYFLDLFRWGFVAADKSAQLRHLAYLLQVLLPSKQLLIVLSILFMHQLKHLVSYKVTGYGFSINPFPKTFTTRIISLDHFL